MRSRQWRRAAVTALLVAGLAGVALEVYTRLPDRVSVAPLKVPPETRELTLVFHGSGGSDEPDMQRIARAHRGGEGTAAFAVNWSPASDNRLRAAANARVVGAELGEQVANLPQLQLLRLVGHSSGAYVLDALCESARAGAAESPRVIGVYLDPFGIHGFADWSHGSRNHGQCADFALAIINTDDAAPATNTPLQQAYTVDITAAPDRPAAATTNLHYWPVTYYARVAASGRLASAEHWTHGEAPRGALATGLGALLAEP